MNGAILEQAKAWMVRRPVKIIALLLCISSVALGACPGRNTPPPVEPEPESPASTPSRIAGLAAFTGEMLRRGAGERTTEEIAEAIEYVGGDLSIETAMDYTAIEVRVLREHLPLAMELLGDLSQRPTFPEDEIERYRQREMNRLAMMYSQPRWLAQQAFQRVLYGADHPYGNYDASPRAIQAINREHLQTFHQTHFVPRNSFLVAVGDVDAESITALAGEHFGSWEDRQPPQQELPTPPQRTGREVIIVHVPGTTQAQIAIGNTAIPRLNEDFLTLRVANQVLGGSASSRLFMNLRERCSYSYGIYSGIPSRVGDAPISINGAVESQHTAGALREIFAELDRLLASAPPQSELDAAQAYMVGHFPIITETAGNLGELVTMQRVYGLPGDYWSTYRSTIAAVSAEEVLAAAREYIHPDHVAIVLVGDAEQIAEPARRYGAVTVVSPDGQPIASYDPAPDQWPGGEPEACPDFPAEDDASTGEEPPAPATAGDFEFPNVAESSLDNGLEVLTVERHQLPLVYVRLVVRAGSSADPFE